MPTTYRLDTAAFRALVLNPSWMVSNMHSRAEAAEELFHGIAPVGTPIDGDDDPGTFRDSVVVTSGVNGGVHSDRAFGRLTSHDPRALSKEYGHTAANGRFVEGSHALVRSMDAMGGFGSARVAQTGGRGTAIRKKRAALAKRRAKTAESRRMRDAVKKFGFEPPVLD